MQRRTGDTCEAHNLGPVVLLLHDDFGGRAPVGCGPPTQESGQMRGFESLLEEGERMWLYTDDVYIYDVRRRMLFFSFCCRCLPTQ